MNSYSKASLEVRETLLEPLQLIFDAVLPIYDHKLIYGYRSPTVQDALFMAGRSQKRGGQSMHNIGPPTPAVDVAPFVAGVGLILGNKKEEYKYFYQFSGVVFAVAHQLQLSYGLRWGGDWDRDKNLDDQNFYDLYHWEWLDG